ncbi:MULTISPECIES: class I adenylate-forming enzyme family protein [Sphingomonas]|jgi:acyl-CoA synthetase (AMP-forming)/AMP-acid ligase II|uniref:Fatty acid--CoA ligase n=1 Tax=Sphingomonas hankookensis TaxID=563996 RepID=A0ABR5YEX3_9SPHN|nr:MULTISPECIES: class I adenylate-forming enzyme family protein [Sphingomonas]KZE17260.1 fatty acid--CoA ligase [Sphingomonas hankookensis]PZT96476.1 MAG: fatty acid--CoA ligase [Sphingomonas sp.]RSV31689.1 long-chain fatty acid--CoA ligase [Sphingomonas sp. ABOLH]WCP71113.1 class I adenylate-forming enzyme family protein [Sphingomonas hankookensis]
MTVPADWPRMSMAAVRGALTAPGQPFEMDQVTIDGIATRVWKNAPANLTQLIALSRTHGDRLATIHEDQRVTYEAQYRAIATLAAELRAMGVAKGDRVALAMRNMPEWPVAFFAIVATGAICVPLNAWWSPQELAFGVNDSGARVLIVDRQRHDRLDGDYRAMPGLEAVLVARARVPLSGICRRLEDAIGDCSGYASLPEVALPAVEILPDDAATIFYTSGTTGRPKGALGTHRNLSTNILSAAYVAARSYLRRGEMPPEPEPKVGLLVIPFFHVTACSASLMGALAGGTTLVLMRKWDAGEALALIERERVQVTGGVPTIAWQLLEHPDREKYDLSSLEVVQYGGAPSAPDLVKRIFDVFGALPGNGWGMTETMATVTQHVGEDYLARPTSCGAPVPVADLKIMADDGVTERPVGEVGELWARGPMIVRGYWNAPEETAKTFVDGWVRTGDLARLDEEGFCTIVDRAKDIIIRGGENIYSIEVEDVLYAHPSVTDAALVGVPDPALGEVPAAVVHLCPGCEASEAELQAFVRARLAAFKVPVAVRFSDTVLPRNANGKILKSELRQMFAAPGKA